jgi:hypothetical protein
MADRASYYFYEKTRVDWLIYRADNRWYIGHDRFSLFSCGMMELSLPIPARKWNYRQLSWAGFFLSGARRIGLRRIARDAFSGRMAHYFVPQ